MPKTTDEQFTCFIEECERLLEKLGLQGWDVRYARNVDLGGVKSVEWISVSDCVASISDRTAILSISDELGEEDGVEEEILDSALHEVIELLLARMHALMLSRYVEPEEADEARHEVIHILRRLLKGVV